MATRADSEPIRWFSERQQDLKDAMWEASVAARTTSTEMGSSEPIKLNSKQIELEYEVRVAARAVIKEHLVYELDRGEGWELALSVLAKPFEYGEYDADDQRGNAMLDLDRFIPR